MNLKEGEKILHLNSERFYEVAEDTTDDDEFVIVLVQFRMGSTIHWVKSRAPINDFIKIK